MVYQTRCAAQEQARRDSDEMVLDWMMPAIYDDLCAVARKYVSRECPGVSRQPSSVVSEVYVRLAGGRRSHWRSCDHLFRTAARMIPRILIDHARRRRSDKRGGGLELLSLDETRTVSRAEHDEALEGLRDALDDLARREPRQRQVVELLYFTGLTRKETAETLGVGRNTVHRDWRKARKWLCLQLSN